MGDFNICDPDEGRHNPRSQSSSGGDASRAAALLAAFPRSVEITQPYFMRKDERRIGFIHTLSRIDRIFVNLSDGRVARFLVPISYLTDLCPVTTYLSG